MVRDQVRHTWVIHLRRRLPPRPSRPQRLFSVPWKKFLLYHQYRVRLVRRLSRLTANRLKLVSVTNRTLKCLHTLRAPLRQQCQDLDTRRPSLCLPVRRKMIFCCLGQRLYMRPPRLRRTLLAPPGLPRLLRLPRVLALVGGNYLYLRLHRLLILSRNLGCTHRIPHRPPPRRIRCLHPHPRHAQRREVRA